MNRSLVKLLIALVVAGLVGTLIARDPGYVMVSYEGHTVQTGLWVFIGLIVALGFAGFYGYRLLHFVLAAGGLVRAWRGERQRQKARRLTAQGLACYNAGAMERAERLLKSSADGVDDPAVNYVYAARAADARGDIEERERCLRLAMDTNPAWRSAALVAGAEMDLERGRYQRTLEALDSANDNDRVTRMKSEAMLALRDWQGLSELMPALKKIMTDGDELAALQKTIALERMAAAETDEALSIIFKKLPESLRHDEHVIRTYCTKLASERDAEVAVRDALNRNWMPHLLALYGALGKATLSRRIKTAETWLRTHSDDPALQLCLGELYEANGDGDKARRAYRKSVDLGGPAEASRHLGRLLAFDGNYKESTEQLTRALTLESG